MARIKLVLGERVSYKHTLPCIMRLILCGFASGESDS